MGTLACNANCTFNTFGCAERCGDGIVQPAAGEECDGTNIPGTCRDHGFYGGTLACGTDCRLVTAGCVGSCGDGIIQSEEGEECEGSNLDEHACQDFGYYEGSLACTGQCTFSQAGCFSRCGDGIIQDTFGETCDGENIGAAKCTDYEKLFGIPGCDTTCQVQLATCSDTYVWGTDAAGYAVAVDAAGNMIVTGITYQSMDGQTYHGGGDIFVTKFAPDGSPLWTRLSGNMGIDAGYAVAVDNAGNILVAGRFSDNPPSEYFTALLIKMDPDGNVFWHHLWPTVGMQAAGVAVANDNSIYVTGITGGPVDGQTHQGNKDSFLARFDEDGNRLWTRQWGSGEDDHGRKVAVDAAGNAYVSGTTWGSLDGSALRGTHDAFLTSFDDDGNLLWTRQWGVSETQSWGLDVACGPDGFVYVSGKAGTSATLAKFSTQGVHQWTESWENDGCSSGLGVGTDGFGGIYVTGVTTSEDVFLTKYNTTGDQLWTRVWGSSQHDIGYGLAVDPAGNCMITGPWNLEYISMDSLAFLTYIFAN